METCKICGKDDVKSMPSHVRMAHQMSMEEYNEHEMEDQQGIVEEVVIDEGDDLEEIEFPSDVKIEDAIPDTSVVAIADVRGNVLSSADIKTMNVEEFARRFDMSLEQLVELVDNRKKQRIKTVNDMIDSMQQKGEVAAKSLIGKSEISTHDLATAEALVTKHGYKCLAVKKGPPKTWVLKKS